MVKSQDSREDKGQAKGSWTAEAKGWARPKRACLLSLVYLWNLYHCDQVSAAHAGVLEEAKNWVAPLLSNTKLQEAFLTYTKPPHTYERLNELSSYVSQLS